MKLLSLEIREQFRSLHPGFKISFHQLTNKGAETMAQFQPFCFAGLNGSGKSNVLECLAAIFYHLELCVAKYRPDSFEKHFNREICTPDAFTLKYLICSSNKKDYVLSLAEIVTIEKEKGKEPMMTVEPTPFSREKARKARTVSLKPSAMSQEKAPAKEYLPDLIVGYSSGENEILSLPFIKNRLIHFDEYKEAVKKGYPFDEPETSLLYIDEEMSQAVLLACILFEDPGTTLKPLRDELGIVGIRSFRMNLNLKTLNLDDKGLAKAPILVQLKEKIDILKSIAACWYDSKEKNQLWLDFYVDDNTKTAFIEHFKTSFNLFRLFQILYELNLNLIGEESKREVYISKGYYTDGKLATAGPEDRVFHFLDYLILKKEGGTQITQDRLLRELSDGEHQFLHTMGICLMLKDRRTLLLLDEPETHFNPRWRAQFIKILDNSIKAGGTNNFLKDILLTSHSPFIIADCLPDNVLFFSRNEQDKSVNAQKASLLGLKTYGSSVDYILKNFFKTNLVSSKSFDDLKHIIDHGSIDELRIAIEHFGESSEKQFLFKKLYEKLEKKDDN